MGYDDQPASQAFIRHELHHQTANQPPASQPKCMNLVFCSVARHSKTRPSSCFALLQDIAKHDLVTERFATLPTHLVRARAETRRTAATTQNAPKCTNLSASLSVWLSASLSACLCLFVCLPVCLRQSAPKCANVRQSARNCAKVRLRVQPAKLWPGSWLKHFFGKSS